MDLGRGRTPPIIRALLRPRRMAARSKSETLGLDRLARRVSGPKERRRRRVRTYACGPDSVSWLAPVACRPADRGGAAIRHRLWHEDRSVSRPRAGHRPLWLRFVGASGLLRERRPRRLAA